MVFVRLQAGPLETVVAMLEALRDMNMLLISTLRLSEVTVPLLLFGVRT